MKSEEEAKQEMAFNKAKIERKEQKQVLFNGGTKRGEKGKRSSFLFLKINFLPFSDKNPFIKRLF